jgi:hypothetical protein
MILQIKATTENGDVIYPERDGDDQTDDELINATIMWQKLKSDLESGVESLHKNILLFCEGTVLDEYVITTQPKPKNQIVHSISKFWNRSTIDR